MLHYPVNKHLWLALCTATSGIVSEWVTEASPFFSINEILNSGTATIIQNFLLFTRWTAKNLGYLCSFCQVCTIYISGKNVGKLTVIQTSTNPHNSVQVSCTPNCFLGGFNLFGGRNEYPWTLPSMKTPNSLLTFEPASSISSTMQDILLQKSTDLKMQGRRSFTYRQKSSAVTWPSKQEFGPRPIL